MKHPALFKQVIAIVTVLLPLVVTAQIKIGQRTIRYNDTTRQRPLVTEVWYPTDDSREPFVIPHYPFVHISTIRDAKLPRGKHPLIMLSHGTGGGRITLEWLADALVQKGFIVASVDHWGNTYDNKIAINFVTPWQRPQDIIFVLTGLLNDKDFGSVIDADRIGAAGFSIGGYTVIALAGGKLDLNALDKFTNTPEGKKEITLPEFPNLAEQIDEKAVAASFRNSPDLMDKRIKAFFAICPAVGQGFISKQQLKRVTAPMYIVGAQSDSIAPVKTNAKTYHKLMPKSKLLIIPGKTGHYVFLNEGSAEMKPTGGIYFNDDATVDRKAIHQQVGDLAAKFFAGVLKY
ncbi:alpha/beta hydrolase family protein [Mucilaginibacter psychrotolerans]|uniref:Dienelactone hydrolase n=1 Tax=Mucilaginibacter psychrotolerans TaxID=1524096 RepID=A0A4Y8SKW8_9SPHI|nr:dienelactone hydrolase [Mucilaginibacter psychrotolerans]TFF39552.1 dienelactone hydrolase [Mucilaginibacter psychrotolerans]